MDEEKKIKKIGKIKNGFAFPKHTKTKPWFRDSRPLFPQKISSSQRSLTLFHQKLRDGHKASHCLMAGLDILAT